MLTTILIIRLVAAGNCRMRERGVGKNTLIKKLIFAALVGSCSIAVIKFIVALVCGCSAMLAEAFHNEADSDNQVTLSLTRSRYSILAKFGRTIFQATNTMILQ